VTIREAVGLPYSTMTGCTNERRDGADLLANARPGGVAPSIATADVPDVDVVVGGMGGTELTAARAAA
jgi:hypothetical protein